MASNAEREAAVVRLNQAVSEGRLTIDEFTDRSGAVYAARTRGDVEATLTGLPEPDPDLAQHPSAGGDSGARLLLGSIKRFGRWRLPAVSELAVKFGTVKLDLRDAAFSAREIELRVRVNVGTIKVVVPDNVRLIVSGDTAVGSRQVEDNPLPQAVPAMTVRLIAVTGLGTVKVHVVAQDKPRSRLW